MNKIIAGAIALSVLASAGIANAQPGQQRHDNNGHDNNGRGNHRNEQSNNWDQDRRADRHFKANRYQPPRGYKARAFHRGEQLPQAYRGRGYVVDYRQYGLGAPPRGYQYVRVNNDVVLTAITTGVIASVISQLFQ
jgi:Ni/Co efflux regulator RcnB